jgi:hypothetical protein
MSLRACVCAHARSRCIRERRPFKPSGNALTSTSVATPRTAYGSPSSAKQEARWIRTLVGPKAVHAWFASCPIRPVSCSAVLLGADSASWLEIDSGRAVA